MNQDVNTQAIGMLDQSFLVVPRDDLVTMDDANLEIPNRHYCSLWEVESMICVSRDDVGVLASNILEHINDALGANIACAEHHANLVCIQKLFEAVGDIRLPLGRMEVANQKDQA